MQTAGRREHNDVGLRLPQQIGERCVPTRAGLQHGFGERLGVGIADVDDTCAIAVLLDGGKVMIRNPAAAHQGKANHAVDDGERKIAHVGDPVRL